jgi:hypothetical protein
MASGIFATGFEKPWPNKVGRVGRSFTLDCTQGISPGSSRRLPCKVRIGHQVALVTSVGTDCTSPTLIHCHLVAVDLEVNIRTSATRDVERNLAEKL